jgi:predicted nucleic acid-binding protein
VNFFDTNILIYAQQTEPRGRIARELLASGGAISVQVLNEFTSVAQRKLLLNWTDIKLAVADVELTCGEALGLTAATHRQAVELARDHKLAFYDALIVASALEAGCSRLLTEDLQHGRKFGPLKIENPFL